MSEKNRKDLEDYISKIHGLSHVVKKDIAQILQKTKKEIEGVMELYTSNEEVSKMIQICHEKEIELNRLRKEQETISSNVDAAVSMAMDRYPTLKTFKTLAQKLNQSYSVLLRELPLILRREKSMMENVGQKKRKFDSFFLSRSSTDDDEDKRVAIESLVQISENKVCFCKGEILMYMKKNFPEIVVFVDYADDDSDKCYVVAQASQSKLKFDPKKKKVQISLMKKCNWSRLAKMKFSARVMMKLYKTLECEYSVEHKSIKMDVYLENYQKVDYTKTSWDGKNVWMGFPGFHQMDAAVAKLKKREFTSAFIVIPESKCHKWYWDTDDLQMMGIQIVKSQQPFVNEADTQYFYSFGIKWWFCFMYGNK